MLAKIETTVGKQAATRDMERLRRIMMPLVRATNHPERLNEISIKIVADSNINAGSAGGGEFVITTGLLQKANDEQLRGILAHEIAHDDLGHPVKMQLVGTGVSIGAALLEKVFPGSGAVAPIAGTLIESSYSRPQEFEADRHGVTILRRAGYSKEVMVRALTWIMQLQGQQRRRFPIDPPGNRRAHSCSKTALASAKIWLSAERDHFDFLVALGIVAGVAQGFQALLGIAIGPLHPYRAEQF